MIVASVVVFFFCRGLACVCSFSLGGAARPLPASGGSKQLECPTCRKPTAVRGGRATELLANYAIMGA